MSPVHRTAYFACLYLLLALLASINALAILQGGLMAGWSLAMQLAVIVSALLRRPWSHAVVMAWAGICILAGAAMWFAVLLRGSFSLPMGVVAYKTILMGVCAYLLVYAPVAFKGESRSASLPSRRVP